MLVFGSIRSALALKISGETKEHDLLRTQKPYGVIPLWLYFIKIINIINGFPKIKILMGINQNMGDNDLEGRSSHILILAID